MTVVLLGAHSARGTFVGKWGFAVSPGSLQKRVEVLATSTSTCGQAGSDVSAFLPPYDTCCNRSLQLTMPCWHMHTCAQAVTPHLRETYMRNLADFDGYFPTDLAG